MHPLAAPPAAVPGASGVGDCPVPVPPGRCCWLPGAPRCRCSRCHWGSVSGSPVPGGSSTGAPGATGPVLVLPGTVSVAPRCRCSRGGVGGFPGAPGAAGPLSVAPRCSRCRRGGVGGFPGAPGAAGPLSVAPRCSRCRRGGVGGFPGARWQQYRRSRCRRPGAGVSAVPPGRCQWFPGAGAPPCRYSRCRRGGAGVSPVLPVPPGRRPGAGPAEAACPVPRAPLAAAVTCRAAAGLPLLPASIPACLPRPGQRWERPRSHHEHPQGLQHLGDRLPGDQIPAERGNPNPRREEHQVRAGGHLPGQRSAGGDEGQGGQPQSHPTPDRQRGPVLRGLRALRGSCGAKHPAGVPQVGLSPASPPILDSTCIPERPHLRPPSPPGWHHHLYPSTGKNPRPKLLLAAASDSLLPPPGVISEGSKES